MQGFNQEIPITRFFACVFFIAVGLLLLTAGIVFIVDPYAIWRQESHKINVIKLEPPSASQRGAAVLRSMLRAPDVLILGSSRVRRGFNESLASRLYRSNVQVVGVDALPLSNAKDLFFAISQQARIKRLYLEVSYLTSNACEAKNDNVTEKNTLSWPFDYLSPKDAVKQSLKTLKTNLLYVSSYDSYFDAQGRFHDQVTEGTTRAGGVERDESRYNRIIQTRIGACKGRAANAADIKDLTDMFQRAKAEETEVILLILPVTARWQARILQVGLSPRAVQWKAEITGLASQFQVQVLDYEQRSDLNTLAENSNSAMPMFWDEIHFSNRLGDHILNDMAYASHVARFPRTR
ncbi:hypothetical protein LSO07_26740 [Janthinobacterium sp. PLB04]|uniref:DUF1574 domain-containing protein n=1 Tax=Janthinobacterium lividum TaxID=29581 RepID=A0AAJ4MSR5_9BURK|nr:MULTISPECIES: hypothetical protein [Janthinobacterium]KAB0327008.1 hypothetical protein F3B38_26395 [Janthinobacterium lividum]QSX96146.1 hypothetical protein J3P46_26595 [Janthinobacterium lividum]UGQ36013.1 hypothetical protein LSO07_26740 [Janthinobacterium sp. PLB04]